MDFYFSLEKALESFDIFFKEKMVENALEFLEKYDAEDENFIPKKMEKPSYASFCKIVSPKEVPLRKDFHTKKGLAKLLHAIAHIEFSAIDLAMDAVYRYPFMPKEYKIDWLIVAKDEIRHFIMIEDILKKLGYQYGSFPVHSGLMDAALATESDILERMAVIPRYYEAGGLDVNPRIIKKLENLKKDVFVQKSIDALWIIYKEEISHVKKGDKWFKYICKKRGLEEKEIYFKILSKFSLLSKNRPHINIKARKEAGFSCEEILKLGAKECF